MSVRVFVRKDLVNEPNLTLIKQLFRLYKSGHGVPLEFGRDVPYMYPQFVREARLHHLHLADPNHPWPAELRQFERTSDKHLIYTHGFTNEDWYCLLGVITDDAHSFARSTHKLQRLAQIAQQFRNDH